MKRTGEVRNEKDLGYGVTYRQAKFRKRVLKRLGGRVGVNHMETIWLDEYLYDGNIITQQEAEVIICKGREEEVKKKKITDEAIKKIEQEGRERREAQQKKRAEEKRKAKKEAKRVQRAQLKSDVYDYIDDIRELVGQGDFNEAYEQVHAALRLIQRLPASHKTTRLNAEVVSVKTYAKAMDLIYQAEECFDHAEFDEVERLLKRALGKAEHILDSYDKIDVISGIRSLAQALQEGQRQDSFRSNAEFNDDLGYRSWSYDDGVVSESGDESVNRGDRRARHDASIGNNARSGQNGGLLLLGAGVAAVAFLGYGIYSGVKYLWDRGGNQSAQADSQDQVLEEEAKEISSEIEKKSDDKGVLIADREAEDQEDRLGIAEKLNQNGEVLLNQALPHVKQGHDSEAKKLWGDAVDHYSIALGSFQQSWKAFDKAEMLHKIPQYSSNKQKAEDSISQTKKDKARADYHLSALTKRFEKLESDDSYHISQAPNVRLSFFGQPVKTERLQAPTQKLTHHA